jgi:peptidylprolyl isomerase
VTQRTHLPALLAVAAVAVGGCGSDNKKQSSDKSHQSQAAVVGHPAPSNPSPSPSPKLPASLKDTSKKPVVPRPTGPAPSSLVVRDIVSGKGRPAKSGDQLTMQYVGVSYSDGKQFDASWDRGQPFKFQLGAGMVIPGWDKGLVGIKPGGRRELIIPSDLAYGPQGQPPAIGPNETLIFIVDAVKVSGP